MSGMKGDGLFIQLGTKYAEDERVMEAGPMAELLSIRAALFCKEGLTDGYFSRAQMMRFIAPDIPDLEDNASKLVEVGLWEATEKGYVIVDFLVDNPSAKAIKAVKEQKSMAAKARWHREHEHGGDLDTCPVCFPEQSTRSMQGAVHGAMPESETDPDPQAQQEGDPSFRADFQRRESPSLRSGAASPQAHEEVNGLMQSIRVKTDIPLDDAEYEEFVREQLRQADRPNLTPHEEPHEQRKYDAF